MSMEIKIGQKMVNSWSIVKATYCNKTIISSKLPYAKCYFNYVINIILQLATYNYVCSFYTWLCSPQACNNNNNNTNNNYSLPSGSVGRQYIDLLNQELQYFNLFLAYTLLNGLLYLAL